ncbi:MAG: hypothetical protein GEU79_13095 [Acidimicrobiia bacterium]|nr:hypothetical protein [Acidimicrobiia bacterium]
MARLELGVDEIRALLTELGERLQAQGVAASIYVAGGAAIALEFDQRRVTEDIDAVFHPITTVREQATALAEEHGLSHRWLNDSIRAILPRGDDGAVVLDNPGLAVSLASPEHLVAMKMAAFRPRDIPDLELLFRELGISSPEAAAEIALAVYGEGSVVLPERDELILSARAVLNRMK